ncbi:MAG: DUF456 domain-containing protein [Leptolyngbya sp. PLA3]|nr:MAG: DUF456 domain-containing protein [Cyanobacteria bacterium CYA]MCE7969206.1 DUF456 domain-containing protein [Leptolyngbya sp. PL-A3]
MFYVAATIVTLMAFLGVGLTLLTLPGIWVAIGTAVLVDLLWYPEMISLRVLIAALVLGVLAELSELLASAAGSAKAGGTRHGAIWSIVGAIVGAIAGTPFVPILGTVVGGVIGAGIGALLGEVVFAKKTWGEAARIGQGAAVGRLLSTVIKTGFAAGIAVLLSVAAWF